jgi:class 3 adenylate cyclase/TolB-like protein/Tfp pilus assembly protein PilF
MQAVRLKRQLTAILMADVVGYSRLMSTDEEETHSRLAEHIATLIEPKIAEYGGHPVRSMGDGLLVQFDSAIEAVRCAIEMQRKLAEREADGPANRRIRLRIGINTGDVIVDERDIYGNAVNIAARLETLAKPGEIYVTQSVYNQLHGHPNLAFADRGDHRLKNIRHPVRIYSVDYERDSGGRTLRSRAAARWRLLRYQASQRWRTAAALIILVVATAALSVGEVPNWWDGPSVPRSSIVVLPFRNASSDPADEYIADAVTEDLTTDLSRVPGAFVIARATAFTYKNRAVEARQIGRECGVRYLLEGSIRRSGPKLQITAQLIDAGSAGQIWAGRFDTDITDLLELQGEVTGRIAASLDIQLVRAESRRSLEKGPANADAVDLRLRAVGLYLSGITPENTLEARRLLTESVRLDPNSAESWAWLADLIVSDYLNRWNKTGKDQLQEAEAAAMRALALDSNLALAHYARGFIYRTKGEHDMALDAFVRATKANPNFARAYAQQGNQLINIGRPEQAAPLVDKALHLSPRDPSLGTFHWILGRAHFFAGNYAAAIAPLRQSVEVRPTAWFNRLYLVAAYALTGQKEAAKKALEEFQRIPQFGGYTLARVRTEESTNPNDHPTVVGGRQKLHQALLDTGMAEH